MMVSVNMERYNYLVKVLRYFYGIVAVVIGLDKFFFFIVDWNIYVSPTVLSMLPLIIARYFVQIVGIVDMGAGFLILNKKTTQLGAYLVAAWIGMIIINLFMIGNLYDIILRDVAIAVGYITLGRLVDLKKTAQ